MASERQKFYIGRINEVLETSQQSYFADTKTDYIAYAMVYALCWIAEELSEMNERAKDGGENG